MDKIDIILDIMVKIANIIIWTICIAVALGGAFYLTRAFYISVYDEKLLWLEKIVYVLWGVLWLKGYSMSTFQIKEKGIKAATAICLSVICAAFIYFYNNWLHYCAWCNNFPNEIEDLPTYLYFLQYDLTYSMSWIFRYVFPVVGMMAACLGIEVYRAKIKKFEELEQRQLDEL